MGRANLAEWHPAASDLKISRHHRRKSCRSGNHGITFENADRAIRHYAATENMALVECIGHGIDGTVWKSSRQSAIKTYYRHDAFERERDCYRRLFEHNVRSLSDFDVPELLNYHNELQIIEMTIVFPPCILDFGKAYVDSPPDYTAEALAEAEQAEREL